MSSSASARGHMPRGSRNGRTESVSLQDSFFLPMRREEAEGAMVQPAAMAEACTRRKGNGQRSNPRGGKCGVQGVMSMNATR